MKENVKTIDSYQGSEKEVIIFSCVRSNPNKSLGFLTDYRRMNVALTRAKYGMVIIGNASTLKSDIKWNMLLSFLKRDGLVFNTYDDAIEFVRQNDNPDLREAMKNKLKSDQ
jgi:superfamily I DNA and/or RNA helicase